MMNSHPLHSPNLPRDELDAYLKSQDPPRHRHSLVETSEHDAHLVVFLGNRMEKKLIREVVDVVESILTVPPVPEGAAAQGLLPGGKLPSPPVTPARQSAGPTAAKVIWKVPTYLHPNYKPFEQFVFRLVEKARCRPAAILHCIILLERMKAKFGHVVKGMHCSHHRVFIAALVVSTKYLNDATPKNYHWSVWCEGIFQIPEITEMESQLLSVIGFNLKITEKELLGRFYKLIYPAQDARSRLHPDAFNRIQGYIMGQKTEAPPTPVTPADVKALTIMPFPQPRPASFDFTTGEHEEEEDVPFSPLAPIVEEPFTLQPVPEVKKRAVKPVDQGAPMALMPSKSEPAELSSLTMPLVRSRSSDGFLERATASAAMRADSEAASSSVVGTLMTNGSSQTSGSATSSVNTPVNHSGSSLGERSGGTGHFLKPLAKSSILHRRGSEPFSGTLSPRAIFEKMMGVGRNVRRNGQFVKHTTEGKASATTVIPSVVVHRDD